MKSYPRLSPEDEKAFLIALESIWDLEGYDCLVAMAFDKGIKAKATEYGTLAPAEQVTMKRSDVICIVTDRFAGGAAHSLITGMPAEQFKRIREWMIKTPSHIVDNIVKKKFTAKHYGA